MFGKSVKRTCTDCNEIVSKNMNVGYMYKDKTYFTGINCPKCGKDLCAEDKAKLQEACNNGEEVLVIMY